jgi:hypothetical protein
LVGQCGARLVKTPATDQFVQRVVSRRVVS